MFCKLELCRNICSEVDMFQLSIFLSAALIRKIILLLRYLSAVNLIEIYVLIEVTRFKNQSIFHLHKNIKLEGITC